MKHEHNDIESYLPDKVASNKKIAFTLICSLMESISYCHLCYKEFHIHDMKLKVLCVIYDI